MEKDRGTSSKLVRFAEQDTARKNAEASSERKSLLAKLAGDFEAVIGNIVGAVSSASGELTSTATTLTKTAETTQQLSSTVAAPASSLPNTPGLPEVGISLTSENPALRARSAMYCGPWG